MSMWLVILFVVVVLVGFVAFTGAPYVPSKPHDVARAFTELYPLGEQDHLVDIGSGDGIVLRAAASYGARATGYEIHPLLHVVARFLSRGNAKVRPKCANFWQATFPADTTVVYTFGDSRDIAKMMAKVQAEASRLDRRLWFISYAFTVPGYDTYRSVGAHHLYEVKPLPSPQAQV